MIAATEIAPAPRLGILTSWKAALWILAVLIAANASALQSTARVWVEESGDMGHGMLAPLAAGYIVWERRSQIAAASSKPAAWGWLFVLWGAVQLFVATAVDMRFLARSSILISLIGCIVILRGLQTLRLMAYPLMLLVLMVPPPTFFYERITLPLQMLASRMAEWMLDGLGYSVLREGNILELVGERLEVAEACSGLRSLVALFFFAVLYNYFFVYPTVMRIIMLLSVIPIGITVNCLRIVATGIIGQYDRALAHGTLHDASGYIGLIMAGVLFVGFHFSLDAARRQVQGTHARA